MKIEIELLDSTECKITVEGETLKYGFNGQWWSVLDRKDLIDLDAHPTIAGMVISKLLSDMPEILQAWLPDNESPSGASWEPWEELDKETADETYSLMRV